MPKTSPRPSRQAYNSYDGVLGRVVGQAEERESNGALQYKLLCVDCGEVHLRNATLVCSYVFSKCFYVGVLMLQELN